MYHLKPSAGPLREESGDDAKTAAKSAPKRSRGKKRPPLSLLMPDGQHKRHTDGGWEFLALNDSKMSGGPYVTGSSVHGRAFWNTEKTHLQVPNDRIIKPILETLRAATNQ